jgi:hypothetical protein
VIPEYFLSVLGPMADIRTVPLVEPLVETQRGPGGRRIAIRSPRWCWPPSSARAASSRGRLKSPDQAR